MITKTCSKCVKSKPITAFYRRSTGRVLSYCKSYLKKIHQLEQIRFRKKIRVRRRKYGIEYRRKNKEKLRLKQLERGAKHPRRERRVKKNGQLVANYGITLKQFNVLLKLQDGKCAICRRVPSKRIRFGVDHNHATGTIRGILCGPCNHGIGMLKDNVKLLCRAIAYLKRKRIHG